MFSVHQVAGWIWPSIASPTLVHYEYGRMNISVCWVKKGAFGPLIIVPLRISTS